MTLFQQPRPTARPYQDETLGAIERLYGEGVNRQLAVLATGLGKAILFALLPERFPDLMEKGMLVLVHRKELVEQAAEKIRWANPYLKVHIEMGSMRAWSRADVVVASVQTLGREGSSRLAKFAGRFGIVIIDECFTYDTKVQTEDGLMSIGTMVEFKYGGQVRTFDGNKVTWSRAVRWIKKRPTHRMVKVSLGRATVVRCTENHEFYTARGKVEAKDLREGDAIITSVDAADACPALNSDAYQIVYGSRLGDGYLSKPHRNMLTSRLTISHHESQRGYAEYKAEWLKYLGEPNWSNQVSGYSGEKNIVRAVFPCSIEMEWVRQMPDYEVAKRLDPLGLAVLFLDDGTRNGNHGRICCPSLSDEARSALIEKFASYGIEASRYDYDEDRGLKINGGKDGANFKRLSDLIAPYTPPCMRYKLHPDTVCDHLEFPGDTPQFAFMPFKSREFAKDEEWVYCLEVEHTHNFLIGRTGVVVSNCHHVSVSSQYDTVLNAFGIGSKGNDGKRLSVGFTATPNRNDGKGLHYFYDDIAANLDVRWGVENGYLVDIRAMRIQTGTDISQVKTQSGDFAIGELEGAINTHERNEVIVKAWLQHGGRQAIAFCAGVKQAYDLAETFNEFGIDARAIDGSMEKDHREIVIDAFRKGQFPVLTNCAVATEGFDVPSIDTVLLARPTKSAPLHTQMLGRGTRPVINPTQETAEERVAAIRASHKPHLTVIDFTDNCGKHAIVTTPKLFGLDAEFELKGKSVFEVVRKIEEAKAENPTKNFSQAKSLDEVEIIARTVNVWDIAELPKCLEGVTQFHWMDVGDGTYQLHVPASMMNERDLVVRLESDRLGRYQAEVVKPAVFKDGRMVAPKEVQHSSILHNSYEDAIHAVDAWVDEKFAPLKRVISQGQKWQESEATDKQINFLRRLGVSIPKGAKVSRGQAARLINAAKARKAA